MLMGIHYTNAAVGYQGKLQISYNYQVCVLYKLTFTIYMIFNFPIEEIYLSRHDMWYIYLFI